MPEKFKSVYDDAYKAAKLEFIEEPMDDYYNHPLAGIFSRLRVKRIIREIGKFSSKNILEVGCEAGYVSIKLAENGGNIIALDIIEEAIDLLNSKINKYNIANIKTLVCSAHNLDIPDSSIDVIVCTEVIEHMPRLDIAIEEFYRVLNNKGKVIITFPNEKLRKYLYPFVSFLGINTSIESEVTLFDFQFNDVIDICKSKFIVEKKFSIPLVFPITRFLVLKKGTFCQ